jgi:peptidylprolyl isomerase
VTALVAVGLVGCSTPAAATCPPSLNEDLIDVSGSVGTEPEVTVRAPFHTDSVKAVTVDSGDGAVLTSDGQTALIDVTVVSGETGESVVGTRYSDDLTQIPTLAQLSETFPVLSDALQCAAEGSRVAVAVPADGVAEEAVAGLGLEAGESVVLIVDVRKVYLAKADGADQFTTGHNVPTVVRAPDGRPGVIVPDGDAPDDLVVEVLKRGDGPEVTGDAPVRVHYTGVLWDDPTEVFESTWDSAPASLPLDGVVPGLAEALEGQTVGSQVLAVIPPDLGYGETGQGAIPENATLIFVVDILGIDD